MNVLQAIRGRRAVRDFKLEPVAEGLLFQLISAASWAPSAMNEQPWFFTIVTDQAVLDEISSRSKTWMLQDLQAVPRPSHFRDILMHPDFDIFYNAPCLIVISTNSKGPWMAEDGALAAQNLMLMATDLGLGSCWIGFAQGWLNTAEGHNLLNLLKGAFVVAPIIVGHPRTEIPPVARKAPFVNWIGQRRMDGEYIEEPVLEGPGIYGAIIHP